MTPVNRGSDDNPGAAGVPFLLAGGNPNWKPREPVLDIRKRMLMTTDDQSPYKRANRDRKTRTYKEPRSAPRSRRSMPETSEEILAEPGLAPLEAG